MENVLQWFWNNFHEPCAGRMIVNYSRIIIHHFSSRQTTGIRNEMQCSSQEGNIGLVPGQSFSEAPLSIDLQHRS